MVNSINFLLLFSLLVFAPFCHCKKKVDGYLYPQFYDDSCPKVEEIVKSVVAKAVAKEHLLVRLYAYVMASIFFQ